MDNRCLKIGQIEPAEIMRRRSEPPPNGGVTEIIYYNTKAYVYVQHDYGTNDYLLHLNTDNTITIEYLTFLMY